MCRYSQKTADSQDVTRCSQIAHIKDRSSKLTADRMMTLIISFTHSLYSGTDAAGISGGGGRGMGEVWLGYSSDSNGLES